MRRRSRSRSPRGHSRHARPAPVLAAVPASPPETYTVREMSGKIVGSVALSPTETVRTLREIMKIPEKKGNTLVDGSDILSDSTPLGNIRNKNALTVVSPYFLCRCYVGAAARSNRDIRDSGGALHVFGLDDVAETDEDRPQGDHECYAPCTHGMSATQLIRSLAGLLVAIQDSFTHYETRRSTWITFRDYRRPWTTPALLASKIQVVWRKRRRGRMRLRAGTTRFDEVRSDEAQRRRQRRRDRDMERALNEYSILRYEFKVRVRPDPDAGQEATVSFSIDNKTHEIIDVKGEEMFARLMFETFVDTRPVSVVVRVSTSFPKHSDQNSFFHTLRGSSSDDNPETREVTPLPLYIGLVTERVLAEDKQQDTTVGDVFDDAVPGRFRLHDFDQDEA
jgi:hypothetical protein